jgi:hypothetical protein
MVDSEKQAFQLSESKAEKLKETFREAIKEPTTSPRKLAVMAGRIVSASPAVLPAALYSRALFDAIRGKVSWDKVFPTPESVTETARFWLDNLDRFNGRRWWPRMTSATLTVDASGVGYGGQIEIAGKEPVQFKGTFSAEQAEASSTEREVIGYVAGLAVAAQVYPAELAESSVLVMGDSQSGIAALNQMRSSVPMICSALKEALELCAAFRFDLTARWIPRGENSAADELSREPDPSDWEIEKSLLARITGHFGVSISADLFASDANHVSSFFVSQFFTPGCAAVHALKQDWSELQRKSGEGTAWVFPSPRCAGQALSLISQFRIRAIVCISAKEGSLESCQLHKLSEQGAIVSSGYGIPRAASCCLPSLRVPHGVLNPAFLGLSAFHIT